MSKLFPLPAWARAQQACAAQPLAYCPDFPRLAARHEDWWRCQLSGPPLVIASASTNPFVRSGRLLDLLTRPEEWMRARLAQLEHTHWIGDALPSIRVDFGPVCLSMLLGAPVEFASDTTWTRRVIADDWSNTPSGRIREDNPWWQLLGRLLKLNAENARGRYLAMLPSLGGLADVLLNLRGAGPLCLDVADRPEKVSAAIEALYPAWRQGTMRLWDTTARFGAGAINWVGLWSNQAYHVLECDFNAMISPRAFQELFLPDITRQAAEVGRSVFHLDGPDAARHYKVLLATPQITAIQYVTGAGNSVLPKIEMLKAIQAAGRPLQVTVAAEEAVVLSRQLDPAGLCLLIEHDLDPAGLDALYTEICAPF